MGGGAAGSVRAGQDVERAVENLNLSRVLGALCNMFTGCKQTIRVVDTETVVYRS